MSEINLEFLLGAMPSAEATLYRVLIQLIPAPSAGAPNRDGRQIKMAKLAKLTGYSECWVIELMHRLERKSFIRTDGGSGAVKTIWLLPPGVLRLGRPFPPELTQRKKTRRKAKAPRVAASQPKRRRKETAKSPKPGAEVNVAPPVEKPAAIPARRQEGPMPSIPPASDDPVVLATTLMPPPPPPAPADLMLPAAMMPPPFSTSPGGPAPSNPVVAATTVTPARSRARGGPAPRKPAVRAAKIAPPPSTAPGDLTGGNVVVHTAMMPPAPSAAPGGPGADNPVVMATRAPLAPSAASGSPAAGNTVVTAAKIAPLPSAAQGNPAPDNPVMPAARVTPPPPTEPAAPATPAKRVSPRKSTKKIPAGRSHWESAPIEEMVAYACSLPVTPELIRNLITPGMTEDSLLIALERLCQRIERDGRQPYPDRWSLTGALRTILSDL
jgi:hypothetical protein